MRRLSLSCLLLVMALFAHTQNFNVDSLETVLKSLRGKSKVKAMNEMAAFLASDEPAKAEIMANAALYNAKRIGDWQGMALACDNLGNIQLNRNHFLLAMERYHQGLAIRKQAKDDIGQAQSTLQIGRVFYIFGDAVQGERTLLDALALAKKAKWTVGIGQIEKELGEIYFAQKAYSDALMHYKASWNIWERQLDIPNLTQTAFRIGRTAAKMGDLAQAKSFLQKAIAVGKNGQDAKWMAVLHLELAKVELANEDLTLAEYHNQISFDSNLMLANSFGLAENHLVFGEISLRQGDKSTSLDRFERAKKMADHKEPSPELVELLEKLSKGFQTLGESEQALQIKRASLEKNRELTENKLKESHRLLHEVLLANVTNFEKNQKIELLETMSANDRRIRALMYVLLGLAGFLAALVYIFYKRNLSDSSRLFVQHVEIVKGKEELEELNKELGMKNLSLELLNKKLVEEIAERENIERSSFARDRYLATMSHEMRTPLNVIVGLTHLLMESNPRPDQVERFRTLQFSANELVVFINEVLDFSKIEAGKLDLQSREFDLGTVANNVFEGIESKTVERNLHFYYSFDTRIPRRLIGDDSRFFQILTNLLNNCLDSTKEGMIRAEISLEEQKERDLVVRIEVEASDGGVIRNFKSLSKLSEEESAGDISPRQLSLAITKRLVELQHGRLEIENIFGEATRFTVLMPFKKAFSVQNNVIQLDLTDYSQLQGAKVLVVEDNKINQLVVAKILARNGMEVLTADNGFLALEMVESNNFDLILMDIQMPEMDGYRTTAEIRNHPSSIKQNVPIIALTSSAFLTEKEKAVLFGMNDHVGKPFSPEELLEKIMSCLQVNKKC